MDNLSLSALIQQVQKTLKDNLDPSYWVVAEIGELSVNQKGHCYLELIETKDDSIIAKTRATIWSYTYRNLSTWFQGITGQPLSEGMKILANVKINFHEVFGFSFNIQDIDANYTLGEKERLKLEVINKLVADGIFEMNKELSLPLVPQSVAIISSPTAAGYEDFTEHLYGNPYKYEIGVELFSAIMQGDEAPASIIEALIKILQMENKYDLVVLIRGGGSQLDLDCFNNYDLCSNIAQFPLPIITGIGHERDDTIADMVAHTKQKTPTAVAEFILQGFMTYESKVEDFALKISRDTTRIVQQASIYLQSVGNKIEVMSTNIISNQMQKITSSTEHIRLKAAVQIDKHRRFIDATEKRHADLNPGNILKRGFTFTTIHRNSIFAREVKKDDEITTYSKDQIIESKVINTRNNDKI